MRRALRASDRAPPTEEERRARFSVRQRRRRRRIRARCARGGSMDFGVVLQTNPPAWRTVQLAELAEAHGFDYVWTFDCHLLWQEPYVIYSQILSRTQRVIVGPMVTNPATRDWTVTASLFATLERDVRQPDGLRHRPRRLGGPGDQRQADDGPRDARGHPRHPRAGQLPVGGLQGLAPAVPVGADLGAGGLGRRVRAAGAQGGRRGRRRLHPAAGRRRHRRVDDQEPSARRRPQRRPGPGRDHLLRRRARVRRQRLGAHARPVPLVRRHGRQPRGRHRGQVRRAQRRSRRR